jgi:hypothetical protein
MAARVAGEIKSLDEYLDRVSLASAQAVYARFDALWISGKPEERKEQEFLFPYVLMHEARAKRESTGF